MTNSQIPLFPSRTTAELVEDIENLTKEIQDLYCLDDIPWVVGYSAEKIVQQYCNKSGMRSRSAPFGRSPL